jgi:hypothetical protein
VRLDRLDASGAHDKFLAEVRNRNTQVLSVLSK